MRVLEVITDRRSSYAFFSRMFREEVSSKLLSELVESHAFNGPASRTELGVFGEFLGNLKGSDLERAAADLAAEYAGLFLNADNFLQSEREAIPALIEQVQTAREGNENKV